LVFYRAAPDLNLEPALQLQIHYNG
jgi:hypothetical protein